MGALRLPTGQRVDRLAVFAFAVILVVTLARVAATYTVFSHTVDEPAHVYAGQRFLAQGRAEIDLVHPPLARLAVALGPTLVASRYAEACALELCTGSRYWHMLIAARLGVLPFLALLLTTTWLWGWRIGGPAVATIAVTLLANLPPVLAHAGLATTDIPGAATLMLALFGFTLWLERPTTGHAVALGVAASLAIGTKLSAVLFLPAGAVALAIVQSLDSRSRPHLNLQVVRQFVLGSLVCVVGLWAIYGFTLNPIVGLRGVIAEGPAILRVSAFPLVELARGVELLADQNAAPRPSYFMGEIASQGWWYFFPVMIAVKTPLPFLIMLAYGLIVALRRRHKAALAVACAAALILAIGMMSRINIGLRHVIAFYPLASLVGATGAAAAFGHGSRSWRAAAAALCLWLAADVALAHPDYLAYFNEPARADAPYFSADSDFDWGQDAGRLADELVRRRIGHVAVALSSAVKLPRIAAVETTDLWPSQPAQGWVAASIGRILIDRVQPPYLGLRWLACQRPVARAGKTILLYHVAPGVDAAADHGCDWHRLAPPPN